MTRQNSNKTGFTIIELTMAMVASVILIVGMGSILFLQFQGIGESADFREASARVDLIRHLTFDGRTGSKIAFPAASTSGEYTPYSSVITSGSVSGHRVVFTASNYDPNTGITVPTEVRWESQTSNVSDPSNLIGTDTLTVARFIENLTATGGTREPSVGSPGDWILLFQEPKIDKFIIFRDTTNNVFMVDIETHEGDEDANISLAITLRNVTQ